MKRRNLIFLTIGAVPFSFVAKGLAGEKNSPHWGYKGEHNPNKWGDLSKEYQLCKTGVSQSPINLEQPIGANLQEIAFDYKPSKLRIINNGHTIQANYDRGSKISFKNKEFELVQFHFHLPSEHLVSGKDLAMELHLVHAAKDNELAVVGVLMKEGIGNQVLAPLWNVIPKTKGKEIEFLNTTIDANQLLPNDRKFYRYDGSLTTPPCAEKVNWIVMTEPIEVSTQQVQQFAQIFPLNARPIQKLNRRFLLLSQ